MTTNNQQSSFSYLDLFSGCGGFSVGLEAVGGRLMLAIERSPMAAETFMRNIVNPDIDDAQWVSHLRQPLAKQAEARLIVGDVTEAKLNGDVRDQLLKADLDLVVGGPPCQGFSLAGRRNPQDRRNSLAWDFLDYVEISAPKVVIIENVLGMNLRFGSQEADSKSVYSQVAEALEQTGSGYIVQKLHLNSLHYGAAQNRERLFLVGCRKDIALSKNISSSGSVWKSDFSDLFTSLPDLAPIPTAKAKSKLRVRDAWADFLNPGTTSEYLEQLNGLRAEPFKVGSHPPNMRLRIHGPRTVVKFELYLALHRLGLSPLLMRDGLGENDNLRRGQSLSALRTAQIYPILDSKNNVLASDYEHFRDLLEKHKTRKHSQRVLDLNSVPPTVITSPDDYIHPLEPRVLSVRELARFQGFGDNFTFYAKETTGGIKRRSEVPQYSQVGNAVSPFVSLALGKLVQQIVTKRTLVR
jgi:DNA (cytosine-5)-methyltransferase 1